MQQFKKSMIHGKKAATGRSKSIHANLEARFEAARNDLTVDYEAEPLGAL